MKQFRIRGFEVLTNSDTTEGRGIPVHVAYTFDEQTANEIAKGRGVMGTMADVKPIDKTICILDSFDEFEELQNVEKREKALAKLTDEEKQLLGLN